MCVSDIERDSVCVFVCKSQSVGVYVRVGVCESEWLCVCMSDRVCVLVGM